MSEAPFNIKSIDLSEAQLLLVDAILQTHVPELSVWAFGSRVTGNARPYSDLDLAVITERPLPPSQRAALAEASSESDLPWKVDLVDWATTSEAFRQIIERDKVVLQKPAHTATGYA